jgi:hypothetical protein
VDSIYQPTAELKGYAIFPQPKTGRKVIKYSMGVAIGELPFFLPAHAYALTGKDYKPDGYTAPYKVALIVAAIAWTLLGFFFLGRFLMQYYDSSVAAWVVLIIGFGTNLFAYTLIDVGMSHAWMFLLFSAILFCTQQMFASQRPRYFYWLGGLIALTAISRPIDVAIFLIPLLWLFKDYAPNRAHVAFLHHNRKHLLGGFVVFTLVLCLQLGYWKYTSGNWLHFSYEGEGFDFSNPQIINGLFSYQKGWFVYTPIAFIGILSLIPLYFYDRKMSFIVLFFFALMTYLIFSWEQWYYGWGFGCRPMVEALAVLSIPLGALVHFTIQKRNRFLKSGLFSVFCFFIWLNVYQSYQYNYNVLVGHCMTKDYYWRIWNRMQANDEDRKYLNE